MADMEKRLGFGEAATLSAEEADTARELIEDMPEPTWRTPEWDRWRSLYAALIPPPAICSDTREAIMRSSVLIGGMQVEPTLVGSSYETLEEIGDGHLKDATEAFEARPSGCEMEFDGVTPDCYTCYRCFFEASVSITN